MTPVVLNVNFYENYAPQIIIGDTLYLYEDIPTIFEYSIQDSNDDEFDVDVQYNSDYLSIEHTDTTVFIIPQDNWNGETSINILVNDGNLVTESIVSVFVLPVNDEPIAYNQELSINEDDFVYIQLSASDIDNSVSKLPKNFFC